MDSFDKEKNRIMSNLDLFIENMCRASLVYLDNQVEQAKRNILNLESFKSGGFSYAIVDQQSKVLFGIKSDLSFYIAPQDVVNPKQLAEMLDYFKTLN
jgi:hypothetical protein